MDQEPKNPLILGRPFLATAGAIIYVKNGKIDFHLKDEVMKFNIDEVMKKPEERDRLFYIDDLYLLEDNFLAEIDLKDEKLYEELQTIQNGEIAEMITRDMFLGAINRTRQGDHGTSKQW